MAKPGATDRSEEEAEFCKRVGNRIREFREASEISQRELARRLKIEQPTLWAYESGQIDMPSSRLYRIAETLNVSPALLLTGDETEWIQQAERALAHVPATQLRALLRQLFQAVEKSGSTKLGSVTEQLDEAA